MITFLAQDFISFVPLIVVSMAIFFVFLIVYFIAKATKNNDVNGRDQKSTGFFRGLLDEINNEFGQKQKSNSSVDFDKKSSQRIKSQTKNISVESEVSNHTVNIQNPNPLSAEEDTEKESDIMQEMLQDKDILSKFILGEIIMTPKAKRKNIRR